MDRQIFYDSTLGSPQGREGQYPVKWVILGSKGPLISCRTKRHLNDAEHVESWTSGKLRYILLHMLIVAAPSPDQVSGIRGLNQGD